jgi:hypothetical protein
LKIITALVKKIYVNGDGSKRFSRGYDDCITKEDSSMKCSHHKTISLISNTKKIVARILSKIEEVIEEA